MVVRVVRAGAAVVRVALEGTVGAGEGAEARGGEATVTATVETVRVAGVVARAVASAAAARTEVVGRRVGWVGMRAEPEVRVASEAAT